MKRVVTFAVVCFLPIGLFAQTRSVLVATRHASHLSIRSLATSFDPSAPGRNYTQFQIVNGFAANLTDAEIASLRKSPEVLYVEDDVERHAFSAPAARSQALTPAPAAVGQITPYGITDVAAPQAWVAGRGNGVNVAILDTGIDYNHPDLAPAYAGGYNAITKTNDPKDDNGHGTHCAGIIAAADNNIGVVGVAPLARIWSVKVLDSQGNGKTSNVIDALNWVSQQKAQLGGNWVISLSLGSCSASNLEQQAFESAISQGILVVAAAGNHDPTAPDVCSSTTNNSYSVEYPAAYPGVIAVAAVDSTNTAADFSNTGSAVTLSAPGVDVLSTFPTGTGQLSVLIPTSGQAILAPPVVGSPAKDVTGSYVFCNLGKPEDFPASVAGKIALIKRGDITFHDKAQNAKRAGAIAVVIFNKDSSAITWTLIGKVDQNGQPNPTVCNDPNNPGFSKCVDNPADLAFDWPLTVGISLADGTALSQATAQNLTVSYQSKSDYQILSGTSMACPHVTGAAAVAWSVAPSKSADDVKQALISTARDLGPAGVDNTYGNGLINVFDAAKQLNPAAFGSGGSPAPTPPTGRNPGRRGH
jgi:subtilisin family serine protease